MTQFSAFKGLYTGTHALMLGGGTIVYLADTENKTFVVEQHGQVIDQGRLTALQAKHFTEAATGAREIERTAFDLGSFTHGATA
jgi:hypothetical protein